MRIVLERVEPWYDDLASCLHSTLASVVAHRQLDPLVVLGSGWTFAYSPGEWAPAEFFYPALGGSLAATLAPHQPLSIVWREPGSPEEAEQELVAALAGGRPAIVAVDNYWLPFRPAFRDVHAAHLVVVYGHDSERGSFAVLDAVPPAFRGWISRETLARARGSDNPAADDEAFFRGAPIANRWLDVDVDGAVSEVEPEWLGRVVAGNLAHMLGPSGETTWTGLAGVRRYVEWLAERAAAEDGEPALKEAYGFGWAPQASAALHGAFLHAAGLRLDAPGLREAARTVDLVAHAWTPLRVGAGHAVSDPPAAAGYLARRGRALVTAYEAAIDRLRELAA